MGKLESFKILIFVICFIVLLPILLPWAMISSAIYDRRKRRLVEKTRCICGTLLGTAALKLSQDENASEAAELNARYPECCLRLERSHDAICMNCGQWYLYESAPARFVPVDKPDELFAQPDEEKSDIT